jgi:hypothetical protein
MLFKSGLLTQVSGSVGGMTGSHNRGGMYLRARAVPVNQQTTRQLAIRNAVTALTSRWSDTLTQAQRDAWDVYGSNVPVLNPLGDQIQLSGQQHYVRSNVPRLQAGLSRVDDGPTTFELGSFTAPSFSITTPDQLDVTFTSGDAWVGEDDAAMLVYTGRPQPSTINFFKGPYRLADSIDGSSGTPPTTPATLTTDYQYTSGQKLFTFVRVTRGDGRLSGLDRQGIVVP